jgi:thioredoxin-like negative regulator of GroEL
MHLVLQAACVVGGVQSYEQAFDDTQASGRPLVVLVGADWCPGCRTMKHAVLPRMQTAGRLAGVNYVEVDTDHRGRLADQLMRGGTIPQLIVFSQGADGRWHREQFTGATSEAAVGAAIQRAVERADTRVSSAAE